MPSVQQPTQGGSNGKKQQSISRFFAKKAPIPSSIGLKASSSPNDHGNADHSDSLFISSDDDSPLLRRTVKKGRIREQDENEADITTTNDSVVAFSTRKRLRLSDSSNNHNNDGNSSTIHKVSLEIPACQRENDQLSHPIAPNSAKKQVISDRTAKYLFSGSPVRDGENCDDSEDVTLRKERLHQRFIKKLGRPDSIAEIKRRNWQIEEETFGDHPDADDDGGMEQEEPSAKLTKRKGSTTKRGASKLTPMEKQVLEIKNKNPDTLLVVEVGYKFRFFGEDARTAAKELSIVCIPGKFRYDEHPSEAHLDRFASASIPVHRLHVHVKRLVAAGHKVGVVRQLETAALKAVGDNRNTPFVRKLTNVYTKGTYIDDVEGLGEAVQVPAGGTLNTGYLLCITEDRSNGWLTDENVHIGIVAVQPATGDVTYDNFDDGFMRSEIETRLLHIAPCELLIVGELSKSTEKLVQHLSGSKTNVFGDNVRVERVDRPRAMTAQAYSHVSDFYAQKMKALASGQDAQASALLGKVLNLAENVTICLSAMITHMTEYGLEHVFDLTKYFQSFSARSHMLLNGTTLSSLEIYQNQTDHSEKGSLFWSLDRTKTRFGQRLLREWVGRPLLDSRKLEERISAVEELRDGESTIPVDKIKLLISKVKVDLEKSLIRIYYGKCSRPEVLTVLQTMQQIANEFAAVKTPKEAGFRSNMINEAITTLPMIHDDVVRYLEKINSQAAKADDKYRFFRDTEETDAVIEHKLGIATVELELDAHREVAAQKLRKKKVVYVNVSLIEYLIEVDNTDLKNVPASWIKISGTKKLSRFHTPEVVQLIRERDQHKEALAAACDSAFSTFLADISSKYQLFRDTVQALATLDCLLSLALVASQPGYVKPEYTDDICISVQQGRHPMVEQLLLDAYVPNDIDLKFDQTRALLITGPNMGGKSSYVRQVALIAIMGQIGSYVPALSAKLGMLDAVFTRMGAFDNMMAGESTFMVELSETSDILKQASPRSLVILDELGRGTSTHDGVAIAQAVLDHLVRETRSLTLFITHYQNLSAMAKAFEHGELNNVHMTFTEGGQNGEDITFLYEVGEGVAHRSYGLNVARLATIPGSVLDVAAVKSKELENDSYTKNIGAIAKSIRRVFENTEAAQLGRIISEIEQL